MKNVFKKLFSLMLVAVMLVSVLPMTAMADEEAVKETYTVALGKVPYDEGIKWVQGENYITATVELAEGESVTLKELFGENQPDWAAGVTSWTTDAVGASGEYTWGMSLATSEFHENKWVSVYPATMPTSGGGTEGGGDTATEKDVTVNFKFGETTIKTTTTKVGIKDESLSKEKAAELFGSDSTYVVDQNVSYFGISATNVCNVALVEKNPANSKIITLMGLDVAGKEAKVTEFVIREGETVPTLTTPSKSWKKEYAKKYYSVDGKELVAGENVSKLSYFSDVYYAKYNDVSEGKDGLSKLNVYASLFSAGVHQENVKLFDVILDDDSAILGWLDRNNDRVVEALKDSYFDGYQRTKDYFYKDDGTNKLSEQNTLNNGDKTVYVRLEATEAKTAKVVLYIHSKLTDTHPDYEVITGYVKNGKVTRDNIWSVIKKEYKTTSSTKLDGLYSQAMWDQKVSGQTPDAVNSLDIDNNDLYEVHVILTSASSKGDSSNPKTGDSIFMTATVMTVSVTALAVLVLANKKRMVK